MSTPKDAGFRMPAEWTEHARTWMMWPCRGEVWRDPDATRRNYAKVAHAIRDYEPLTMVVRPEHRAQAHSMLGSDVELMEHPIDDSWARDAGPCFLVGDKGARAGVAYEFNAWGGKYAPFDGDNSVADAILAASGVTVFSSDLVAEGGGVSVDGKGTILTTETCFPNKNRNPNWSRDEIEQDLLNTLGGEKAIWLPGNVEEIETDGHVDGIAVFVAPGKVLVQDSGPRAHYWHDIHRANLEALGGQTDAWGQTLELIRIPDAWEADVDDDNFCDSYVNSYICNGAVIMPKYNLKEDGYVREVFQEVLPGRDVIAVEIWDIAMGGGGIHCITQQEPVAG
ncbi:MAG: agmatine deiminase family protein [Pseudomonadota bacterium]